MEKFLITKKKKKIFGYYKSNILYMSIVHDLVILYNNKDQRGSDLGDHQRYNFMDLFFLFY